MKDKQQVGKEVVLRINGKKRRFLCQPGETLLTSSEPGYIITEVKEGCGKGDCGAWHCASGWSSCGFLPCSGNTRAEGKEILTAKGLGTPERIHPLQKNS